MGPAQLTAAMPSTAEGPLAASGAPELAQLLPRGISRAAAEVAYEAMRAAIAAGGLDDLIRRR